MKIDWRAGLLIILLAVPAFLFLFLFFFGENQFDLPYKFPVAVDKSGEQQVLIEDDAKYSDFIKSCKKPPIGGDSLYLKFPVSERQSQKPHIIMVYYNENNSEPGYNQYAELIRLEDKVKNQKRVRLLKMYENRQLTAYWKSLFQFIKTQYPGEYSDEGIMLLIDEKGYFRGVYKPYIKAEIDRLITEYQIILKF
jgi:protein SCO1/2